MANNTRLNYLTQRRDNHGRFAPTRPNKLRRGSLYSIPAGDGGAEVIARYRAYAFGPYHVFSTHNEPFIAERKAVKYATKDQVEAYLQS